MYFVGIDVSKKDFHCSLGFSSQGESLKTIRSGTFSNNLSGFKKLDTWLNETIEKKGSFPLRLLMEATGVYYENLALYLHKQGFYASVILPNKAKKYMEAIGLKSKNDKIDAKGLSRMCSEQKLEKWEPLDGYYYELRALTRHYQSLQEQITAFNNCLEASKHGMYVINSVIQSDEKIIKLLTTQLEVIRNAIDNHIASNSVVASKVEKIINIKGVSVLTIAVIIAETNGFFLFKNSRQLASYTGYDVVENQSGQRTGRTKISKKGNVRIRRCLHMPALCVVKYEPKFRTFYERLATRHTSKMKSYVAVQKKLLTIIYALWKKDEAYLSEYEGVSLSYKNNKVLEVKT